MPCRASWDLEELPRIAHSEIGVPDLPGLAEYINKLVGAQVLTPGMDLEQHLREAAKLPEADVKAIELEQQEQEERDARTKAEVMARLRDGQDEEPEEDEDSAEKLAAYRLYASRLNTDILTDEQKASAFYKAIEEDEDSADFFQSDDYGGAGSGNWGHKGRRGKRGGSTGGAGLSAIGATAEHSPLDRIAMSQKTRAERVEAGGWPSDKRRGEKIRQADVTPGEKAKQARSKAEMESRRPGAPPHNNVAEDQLRRFENGNIGGAYERGFAVDKNGNVIFDKRGERSSISISKDEVSGLNGASLVHNHPSGSSLSSSDIAITHEANMSHMRAVGIDGTGERWRYSITPEEGWQNKVNMGQLLVEMDTVDKMVTTKRLRRVDTGALTLQEAGVGHWHEVNTILERNLWANYKTRLNYKREKWDD
jgi:hypothetical protein